MPRQSSCRRFWWCWGMSDWVHSSVGAVTLYQRAGGTPTATTDAYYGGEIPFVTIEDITNGTRYLDKTVKNLSELGLRTSAAWLIKEPHILYSMYATVGKPIVNRITCATNQAIIALKASEAVEQDFLFYQLLFIRPQVYKFTSQTTQSNLNASSVRKLPIAYPKSRATQRKIASILSTIDTAIEQTEALIEKYQHIKAGLMHDLFTRGVLPNGQLRPTTASVKTPFGLIPKEWRLGSLLELTDPTRQPILTGPFGADLGNNDFVLEGIPVLRIGNVQQGRLDIDDLLYVSTRKAKTLSRYRIKEGDLLFARQGATTGRNALADHRVEGSLINYHIIRVALSKDLCAPLFVETAFNNEVIKRQIERDKGRGTREGINTAQLTSLAFPIAPLAEQRLVSDILVKHKRVISTARIELNSLRMRKLGLMQDLLSGKVPVKVEREDSNA